VGDRFRPPGAGPTAEWIAAELDGNDSIFGLPRSLWYVPSVADRYRLELGGHRLETPIGVAAGPHTQLAHNIVAAWLCGARMIELKTVQTLDAIDVAKPCIDMLDEGYNTEWSQELTVDESVHEYLTAWLLIQALHRRLGFPGERPGVLFDLSVGYDLAGLEQTNMCRFLRRMTGDSDELGHIAEAIAPSFPEVLELGELGPVSDSVTISTLHGCPPDEIGTMAEHLMDRWGLHTAVKLNPTLVGYDSVLAILVDDLGWDHIEPERSAFAADIDFPDAVALLHELRLAGEKRNLQFGVKLCNTLPVTNTRRDLGAGGATAYLSGRPLHALAVELARRLADAVAGPLPISFAGGADAFNTPSLLSAGLRPVTTCSDLLRPGGYLRLRQYLDEIDRALDRTGADNLDDLVTRSAGRGVSPEDAARVNLRRYAGSVRNDPDLAHDTFRREGTQTSRSLGLFDCIAAPCTDACAIDQRAPEYLRSVASGDIDRAAEIIAADNPLPSVLGRACHHPCESVCTRTHLDQPLAIREIKRFVTDIARSPSVSPPQTAGGHRVAIVGAGPCGLAAAVELARAGVETVIFEARHQGGGMVSATIPGYRAAPAAVERDLAAIAALGVTTEYGITIGRDLQLSALFDRGFTHIVVAVGAQRGLRLGIEGEEADGVVDGLDFLRDARKGRLADLGTRVAVVGGGDVAMDCARTARRITAGRVEILYRRTTRQMPAHPEEISDLLGEGIAIRELVSPRRVVSLDGRLRAVECSVMRLADLDASGRPQPVEVDGEGITIELDTLVIAIGQRADLAVFGGLPITVTPSGFVEVDPDTLETSIPGIYTGGDLRHPGPSNIVDACGDGRRIARAVLGRTVSAQPPPPAGLDDLDVADLLRRRSHRQPRIATPRLANDPGDSFREVVQTLELDQAVTEAGRCLDCDLLCSTCESVCPNRAIATYFLDTVSAPPTGAADRAASHPSQAPQIVVFADLCNECGNCVTFCPTSGRPWRDKPRLFFDRTDFAAHRDNAFMLLMIDGTPAIQGRFGGATRQLVQGDPPDGGTNDRDPDRLVMTVLLEGLTSSMPHLPVPEADPEWLVDD
jgi:putative selenate reductase